ncbi:MAG TPA: MFS transporter [Chthoniobacteraceae bacterium]|jgi:MFS family permease|nr:MFS transporter [Chthoniobacteraceae bacterium]
MSSPPASAEVAPLAPIDRPAVGAGAAWGNVVLAALLMLATLPGRTQGLGLITEPMLRDLALDHVTYANLNLWGTLLGSAFCLPAGWLIDRFGLRWTTIGILLALAATVWQMSGIGGGVAPLFACVLLTRAFGQSALSVASITAVGKSFGRREGWAMGVYSVLTFVGFAGAFLGVGEVVSKDGWRTAWGGVALGLVVVAALVLFLLREPVRVVAGADAPQSGTTLYDAMRTPFFWVFAGATALFSLVSSGFGLFNEAVLAERGFDQQTFHNFLAVTTLFALAGQMLCGWLSMRRSLARLLAVAMFLYAGGLAALPQLHTRAQLWVFAAVFGVAVGFVTVVFFAAWGQAFGRAQLGRIQGAAQMLTVFASALGPLLFAKCHAAGGSYAPLLYSLAPIVFCFGLAAWWTRFTAIPSPVSPP